MRMPHCEFVPSRVGYISNRCAGKSVLHLGFADALHYSEALAEHRHLHEVLRRIGAPGAVYGIDSDSQAVARFRQQWSDDNLIAGDVEALDTVDLNETFDVIVAGEIIEHLNNPGLMLGGVLRFMSPESILILTTPNALGLKFWLHAALRADRSHPDHTLMLSFSTVTQIAQRHGLEPQQWFTSMEIFNQPRNRMSRRAFRFLFSIRPHLADTLVVELRKAQPG